MHNLKYTLSNKFLLTIWDTPQVWSKKTKITLIRDLDQSYVRVIAKRPQDKGSTLKLNAFVAWEKYVLM